MTSQGTPHGRFQRAIHSRHVQNAETAARELGGLSLATRSCCANCSRTLSQSVRLRLPRQHSPNFDTATETLAWRSLSVCFVVARLRRVARPRRATNIRMLAGRAGSTERRVQRKRQLHHRPFPTHLLQSQHLVAILGPRWTSRGSSTPVARGLVPLMLAFARRARGTVLDQGRLGGTPSIGIAAPFLAPANCASPKSLGINCGAAGLSEGADHPPTTRRLCTASNISWRRRGGEGGAPPLLGRAASIGRGEGESKSRRC
jgi:hypothetical protein